jgi:hypothetical protein
MVALPAFFAVTSPVELTLAIGPSLVCHVKDAPLIALPWASTAVAVSCTVSFTLTDAEGGDT